MRFNVWLIFEFGTSARDIWIQRNLWPRKVWLKLAARVFNFQYVKQTDTHYCLALVSHSGGMYRRATQSLLFTFCLPVNMLSPLVFGWAQTQGISFIQRSDHFRYNRWFFSLFKTQCCNKCVYKPWANTQACVIDTDWRVSSVVSHYQWLSQSTTIKFFTRYYILLTY